MIRAGMNARLFAINWRPARDEIAFAARAGFGAIQFNGREAGIDAAYLGDEPAVVGAMLREAALEPVMEIVVRVGEYGRTEAGNTPLDVLRTNLPGILALGCTRVHLHLARTGPVPDAALRRIEAETAAAMRAGIALADGRFQLGIEHNEPDIPLFADFGAIATLLDAVPDLGFVWDCNHTPTADLAQWLTLAERIQLVHVSDTPQPELNHHLPLGEGTIAFGAVFAELRNRGVGCPAILEIGGTPKSGGFGRDNDAALVRSLAVLRAAGVG
jgi:sugar phosphate isomerase/epimerase